MSSNQVFFDPGYDVVIDSVVTQYNETGYLLFKDERYTGKASEMAKSTTLTSGSFSVFTPNFITAANTGGYV